MLGRITGFCDEENLERKTAQPTATSATTKKAPARVGILRGKTTRAGRQFRNHDRFENGGKTTQGSQSHSTPAVNTRVEVINGNFTSYEHLP